MIDASDEATEQGAGDGESSSGCPMHQSTESDAGQKHKLSNKEIVDISVGLMVAGYDTTSSTLSFTSYLLALHPEIQEKLQSEIDTYYDNKPVSKQIIGYGMSIQGLFQDFAQEGANVLWQISRGGKSKS